LLAPDVGYIVADFLVWQPDRRYDTVFFLFWLSHMAATPVDKGHRDQAQARSQARPAMFAIGCIHAQRCHTGRCPSGVATRSPWLQHGLDPALKSVRCANYLAALRFELLRLARACGYLHPALVPLDAIELLDVDLKTVRADELLDYQPDWDRPGPVDVEAITTLMGNLCGQ
jgi:hypothetical protein